MPRRTNKAIADSGSVPRAKQAISKGKSQDAKYAHDRATNRHAEASERKSYEPVGDRSVKMMGKTSEQPDWIQPGSLFAVDGMPAASWQQADSLARNRSRVPGYLEVQDADGRRTHRLVHNGRGYVLIG